MSQHPPPADSLPKQFVIAMRTLFDIMDDKGTGYVKLTDIENRWRDDRTRGLPKGVIESLQTFASANGLLTFDRFCAGLNLCLLRNQKDKSRDSDAHRGEKETLKISNRPRPASAPLLDVDDEPMPPPPPPIVGKMPYAARERTSNAQPPARFDRLSSVDAQLVRFSAAVDSTVTKSHMYGPPKPPRVDKVQHLDEAPPQFTPKDQYLTIDVGKEHSAMFAGDEEATETLMARGGRGPADGKPAVAAEPAPRTTTRRREPRRHTLQNGIDYNVLKRMKQIEEEKEILMSGLAAVEKAREWYLKELGEVAEKMRHASRMGAHVEGYSEAQQERLELQRARVHELNRQLAALAEGWRRGGLSLHINLAVRSQRPAAALQHQNHLLTEEITKKSERISVLEREKSALIRELLILTNRNKNVEKNAF